MAAGGYDPRLMFEDYPLWLKLARRHPLVFVDDPVVDLRMHRSNTSYVLRRAILRDLLLVLAEEAPHCPPAAEALRQDALDGVVAELDVLGGRTDLLRVILRRPSVLLPELMRSRRRRLVRQASST
jgi:hypothetical protein